MTSNPLNLLSVDWSKAPAEATHATQNFDGRQNFWRGKPWPVGGRPGRRGGLWMGDGQKAKRLCPAEPLGICNPSWRECIEERPWLNDKPDGIILDGAEVARLFERDKAKVGRETAIRRWQMWYVRGKEWRTCLVEPAAEGGRFRRDPTAPPLPPENKPDSLSPFAALKAANAVQKKEIDSRRGQPPEFQYANACFAMTAHLADMYAWFGVPDDHADMANIVKPAPQ